MNKVIREIPYADDDFLCERKVENAHDTHTVAIRKDIAGETATMVVAHLLTAQSRDQTFVHELFKKLAKKTWRIDLNSPNSPKFFTAKVFYHTVSRLLIL